VADGWITHIPPEYAQEPLWDGVKGKPLGEVLKGYAEAQKYIGGAIRVPKPDATPEERDKFYAKLGRPETPDKYGVEFPTLPEGLSWDQSAQQKFFGVAHQYGLTPSQARGLIDWYTEYAVGQQDAVSNTTAREDAEAREAAKSALTKQWGPPTGATYQRNWTLATKALTWLAQDSPQLTGYIEDALGNDPRVIQQLATWGERLVEDQVIPADGLQGGLSTQDVQAQIDAIRANPNHPIHHPAHPGYDVALAEFHELYRLLHGPASRTVLHQL